MSVQVKTITLDKFTGLDNVAPPEKTDGLQACENFYVTDTLQLDMRPGRTLKVSGAPHSLWSDGDIILYREGEYLKRLMDDLKTSVTLRSGLAGNSPMNYLSMDSRVYYTDGTYSGIVEHGVSRTWGLTVPSAPGILPSTGSLVAGQYQVALTYIRNDGQESGASDSSIIDLTAAGGMTISFVASLDPTVVGINIYVTGQSGEVFFLLAAVPNTTSTLDYRTITGKGSDLKNQFASPPPPGHMMTKYNGRIYIAQNNVVWYTNLYAEYELINMEDNFQVLNKNVTMLAAVKDGLWVATDEGTFFWGGTDVSFQESQKLDSGAIPGSAVSFTAVISGKDFVYKGPAVVWGSPKYGVCVGINGGEILHTTKDKFILPATAVRGAGMVYKAEDKSKIYTVSMYYSGYPGTLDESVPALTLDA